MERLYQYLWRSGVAGRDFTLVDGQPLRILDPGVLNNDAGPDFFNAKVRLGGEEWVGNIEIHVKASDWFRHGHQNDSAYDSVILHVVSVSDTRINRPDGSLIPQLEIVLPQSFYFTYAALEAEIKAVRCQAYLRELPPLAVTDWLETLAIERIQEKAMRVADAYRASLSDWDTALFITLARALGFGLNSEPFEMLARSLPLKVVYHHTDNQLQVEALLFGQAALLDPTLHPYDSYYQLLCREYLFLARKYGLRPLSNSMWKFARTRPQNFPHRRIAFLARMLSQGLFSVRKLADLSRNLDEIRKLFAVEFEGYWLTHYDFGTPESRAPHTLSRASVDLLVINAVAPLLYAYGSMRGDGDVAEAAVNILDELPAENNTYIRQWNAAGIECRSALRSQALIHLRRSYCDAKKCLSCRFARHLLSREAKHDRSFSHRLFSPSPILE